MLQRNIYTIPLYSPYDEITWFLNFFFLLYTRKFHIIFHIHFVHEFLFFSDEKVIFTMKYFRIFLFCLSFKKFIARNLLALRLSHNHARKCKLGEFIITHITEK